MIYSLKLINIYAKEMPVKCMTDLLGIYTVCAFFSSKNFTELRPGRVKLTTLIEGTWFA